MKQITRAQLLRGWSSAFIHLYEAKKLLCNFYGQIENVHKNMDGKSSTVTWKQAG